MHQKAEKGGAPRPSMSRSTLINLALAVLSLVLLVQFVSPPKEDAPPGGEAKSPRASTPAAKNDRLTRPLPVPKKRGEDGPGRPLPPLRGAGTPPLASTEFDPLPLPAQDRDDHAGQEPTEVEEEDVLSTPPPHLDTAYFYDQFERIRLDTDGFTRMAALRTLGAQMASDHRDLARRFLPQLGSLQDQGVFVQGVVASLLVRGPHEAAEWAAGLSSRDHQAATFPLIAGELARTDPAAAIDWAGRIGDQELQNGMVLSLVSEWAKVDPGSAWSWASQFEDPLFRDSLAVRIGQEVARHSPQAAAQWSQGFNYSVENQVTRAAALTLAATDLNAAAEWALTIADPRVRDDALAAIASVWSETNPAAAAEWARSFPETPGRNKAITTSAYRWAMVDPATAMGWVLDNLSPAEQQTAMPNVFAAWAGKDPATAAAMIGQVPAQEIREPLLEVVGRNWILTDLAAASVWVNATAMPAATKTTLLELIRKKQASAAAH